MPSAQRTVVIHRPIEEVFAFFADPSNDSRWRTHVKEIASTGPITVGSRIHQVISGPGGRGIPADIEVTTYQPPERYAFRVVAGPVRPHGVYRFATADMGTSVSFALQADLAGIKKLFMSGPVQKSMNGEMESLDHAKAILESH